MERGDLSESLPERLIREAMEAGEFDDLPGRGNPLPGAGQPDDDLWWVRAWVKRSAPEVGQRPKQAEEPGH